MNKVMLIGRLTGDPAVRYSQDNAPIARYSLAVDRMKKGEADFINCTAFGKSAEFAEKYLSKGMKIGVTGRIQTGNYKDKDGKTVYTTDVIVETQEFCESKKAEERTEEAKNDDFMNIPDGMQEELPFL